MVWLNFNLDIDKSKRIYFMGIGGVSMSAIALLLKNKGYTVGGSDRDDSARVKSLKEKGIHVDIGQRASNLRPDDIIVYTHAVTPDNEEFIQAKEYNLQMFNRAEFLGLVMKNYKHSIGISGTHGKTTTTSMLSHILLDADVDPTLFNGGKLDIIGSNVKLGESDYFLTEACEYKESFLNFHPFVGIILNIDKDHLDYYRDIDHIEEAFIKYAKSIPSQGFLIMNADDKRCDRILEACSCTSVTFGINAGDVRAENITYDKDAFGSFDLIYKDTLLGRINLSTSGEHNIYNALAAAAAGICLDISFEIIASGLNGFKGTHRRFELLGEVNGCKVIAEYAHHPTEIITALKTAEKLTEKDLICLFQPHTYTRTIGLLDEFGECFTLPKKVFTTDIYAAREEDTGVINSSMLADRINEHSKNAEYIGSLNSAAKIIPDYFKPGNTVMLVGAGDIISIWDKLEKK